MKIFGNVNLSVLLDVESNEETLGLLQANYRLNPDRIVKWKLTAVNCKGHEEIVEVCDCNEIDLAEVVY